MRAKHGRTFADQIFSTMRTLLSQYRVFNRAGKAGGWGRGWGREGVCGGGWGEGRRVGGGAGGGGSIKNVLRVMKYRYLHGCTNVIQAECDTVYFYTLCLPGKTHPISCKPVRTAA